MRRLSFAMVILIALLPLTSFAQGGELLVRSPMQGEQVKGNTVTVVVDTPGVTLTPPSVKLEEAGKHPEANHPGEGHLHLMLDLQPMVIWGQSEPYSFENVAAGDHVLTVEVVQNDHSSFSPPRVQQIRFTSVDAPASVGAPASSSPEVMMMPNTGLQDVAAQPLTFALLVLAGACLATGAHVRRRRS